MPAEHRRPDGVYQGYYCTRCGAPGVNMVGTGHGPDLCEPNLALVQQLWQLNKPERTLMAKYDYGGGCACGLYRTCEPGCKNYSPPVLNLPEENLGEKLQDIFNELESAKIKSLEEKAAADREKIRQRRNELHEFLIKFYEHVVASILAGKVPLKKVSDYTMQQWIRDAKSGRAEHQDIWKSYSDRLRSQKLDILVEEAHDGMGMESWINLSVTPLKKNTVYRSTDIKE